MTKEGAMSLKEMTKPKPSVGLARSMSFGGLNRPPQQSSPTVGVLGYSLKSPRSSRKNKGSPGGSGISYKKSPRMPKAPRPHRALVVFESVKKGLRECIISTEEDVDLLRTSEAEPVSSSSTQQGKLYELDKQIKAAERYKKRLEFQLAKIEELEEHYRLNQQLRDGVRTMARAFVSSSGGHRKESLNSVKHGFKECTQIMCAIEAQLENMMGTLHCRLKGMVGFARLCPGDAFEVTVRHGPQKWKSKGKVNKDMSQYWDNDVFIYKALVGDVLSIKALESRGFGRTVTLGTKNCEIRDLFSSHPQMMTVSINVNGSLKVSILITWNPLEGCDENMVYYEPPSKSQSLGTPKRRPPASPALRGIRPHSEIISIHNGGGDSSDDCFSLSNESSTDDVIADGNMTCIALTNASQVERTESITHAMALSEIPEHEMQSTFEISKPRLFDMRLMTDSTENNSNTSSRSEASSLEGALQSLSTVLEDYQGQYPELQHLEEQVQALERLLKKNCGAGSSRSSSISVSIESALEAFDFLDSEDMADMGFDTPRHTTRKASIENILVSPESTARTADSGIECLAQRLNEDCGLGSTPGSSPEPPSTGNEQVDTALLFHLSYCERLLENLGNFGPLKCKEIYSLDKLQNQAEIIEKLINIARQGPNVNDLQTVMSEVTRDKVVRQFWVKCVDNVVLYTNAERFLAQLERNYGEQMREKFDIVASRVFKCVIARILDIPNYDPETSRSSTIVTLHQMMVFFNDEGRKDMPDYIENLAAEMWMTGRLKSGNPDIVIKTILTFRESLPPAQCLRVLSLLLITNNPEVRAATEKYMITLANTGNPEVRDKAMIVFVEAMEDRNADVRCAACIALQFLQAKESMDQLIFVCQTDSSSVVKSKAKEALFSFGEDGRKAYEEIDLTTHGFQGLNVRL